MIKLTSGVQHGFRAYSTAVSRPRFCFDIDGVLKKGEIVLPEAREALQILTGKNKKQEKFPFILCTNGGGSLEADRVKKLSDELGVEIKEQQLVQSHTIFKALTAPFGDKPIFVVGGVSDRCRRIAETYGFKHAYIPADVLNWDRSIWPFHKLTSREMEYARVADFSKIPFAAILVFHDTFDWGRDIQLIVDLLIAKNGVFGTSQDLYSQKSSRLDAESEPSQLPIYFSNPDLLWGNEFPISRFGQGAFQESVASVYRQVTGKELSRIVGGKPHKPTYDYASKLLHDLDTSSHTLSNTYMIGDNPRSDIQGANTAGWKSILVRTGVYKDGGPLYGTTPTVICDNVLDGVHYALDEYSSF